MVQRSHEVGSQSNWAEIGDMVTKMVAEVMPAVRAGRIALGIAAQQQHPLATDGFAQAVGLAGFVVQHQIGQRSRRIDQRAVT